MNGLEEAYRFRKKERLCSKKMISQLFEQGRSIKTGCLRVIYLLLADELPNRVQVLISVPKKQFKNAVERNLLKRRIREAYRLNKSPLLKALDREDMFLLVSFVYNGKEIKLYQTIEESLVQGVIKLLDVIELGEQGDLLDKKTR